MRRKTWMIVSVALSLLAAGAAPGRAQEMPRCSDVNKPGACGATCRDHNLGRCQGSWFEGCTYTFWCDWGIVGGACSCSTGCFLAGTQITMADGTKKAIEDIVVGDVVLALDKATGEMKPDPVKRLHEPFTTDSYLVVNGHLRITPTQPVFSGGRWREMGELTVNDTLTAADGGAVPIDSIEIVRQTVTVYNFDVNPFETFIADGFIVHRKQETTEP